MPSIQIDEQTAKALESIAASFGMSIEQYLKAEAAKLPTAEPAQLSDAEFESQLEDLTHHGPSLPPDFSRADIYADHD